MTNQALLYLRIVRHIIQVGIPFVIHRIMPETVGMVRAILAGDKCVFKDPPDAGGIRAELWTDAGW